MLKRKSKRVLSIVLAVAMIVGLFPIAAFADEGTSAPTTIYVDASASDDNGSGEQNSPYKTLEKALQNANNGDTIQLAAGEYTAPASRWAGVVVNIQGAGSGQTTIADALWMGAGSDDTTVTDVTEITISGVTFKNDDGASNWSNTGLGFSRINNCAITVKDCLVDGFQHGIHMNGMLETQVLS